MNRGVLSGFQVLLLLLAASDLCFSSENMTCPANVRLDSGNIAPEDIPSGYKPLVAPSPVRLSGVTVFDGPPEDGAVLKPTNFSSGGESIKWAFSGAKENEIWVSCDYANGLIRLVKQVGQSTSSCIATIEKTEPHKTLHARFTCQ